MMQQPDILADIFVWRSSSPAPERCCRSYVSTGPTKFEMKLAELKARQATARPMPPGPARDAILEIARQLGRAAAERDFGPKRTRGQK